MSNFLNRDEVLEIVYKHRPYDKTLDSYLKWDELVKELEQLKPHECCCSDDLK